MSRRVYAAPVLVAVVVLASACSSAPTERQVVDAAAAALGGADRIRALKSIAVEGAGDAPNVGQNRLPDSELPNWRVTAYRRVTDLANDRTDMTQTRQAAFQFAGALTQRQHQAQDGDVAVNFPPNGQPARGSDAQARDRRREALHHPVAAVRAALAESSQLRNLRQDGDNDVVDVRTAKGDVIQLSVSRASKLPVRVAMLDAHPNLVYELSARTWSEHPRSPDYTIFRNETTVWGRWLGLIERHAQRFVIGTDAAQRGNDREKVARVRLFLGQLSPVTRELVATGNLDRLLRR